MTVRQWIGTILVVAMFGFLCAVGLLTISAGFRQISSGEQALPKALLVIAIGAIFAVIGLGYFYVRYVKKPLWDAEAAKLAARYPDQPWMRRKDWASRRIVHANIGLMAGLWIWNIGWWGGLALIGTVNRDKILSALESSWLSALLLAVFVLCGLLALRLAIDATLAHWRYGRTVLRLDTLPAYVGEQFSGAVEARLSHRPEALKAALVCDKITWIRYRSRGSTKSRLKVEEQARIERDIPPSRVLMAHGGARIPVEIDIPPESTEYAVDGKGNGIRWTLHLEAPAASGAPFSCAFEVPVYRRRG